MKRPFALLGFTYLAVLTAVFFCGFSAAWLLFGSGAVCLLVSCLKVKDPYKKKTVILCCTSAMAACAVFVCSTVFYYAPMQSQYTGREVTLQAQITEEPRKSYGMFYYELSSFGINGEDVQCKIMLRSSNALSAQAFDTLHCSLTLEKCDVPYYLSKGFLFTAKADYNLDYTVDRGEVYSPYFYAIKARQAMKHAVDVLMPEKLAQLSKAIALGDKYGLDSQIRADFNTTGMSYIIVVSGLHLTILVSFCFMVLKRVVRNHLASVCGATAVTLCFMAITGFTSSVVRAGVMLIISLWGPVLFQKADSLNSIGFAALFLTLFNPMASGDIGMLLSFSATIGIILFQDFFCKNILKWIRGEKRQRILFPVIQSFSVTLSAFIAITPITLLAFGSVSPIVFLASLLLTPFISVLIISILAASLLYYCGILSVLACPFAFIACVINSVFLEVIHTLAEVKMATVYVDIGFACVFLASVCVLLSIALFFKNTKRNVKYAALMMVMVLLAGWSSKTTADSRKLQLRIFNTAGGTAAALYSADGLAVLDCSGRKSKTADVLANLAALDTHISCLIIPDAASSGAYAPEMLNEFDVDSVLLYDTDKTNERTVRLAEKVPAAEALENNAYKEILLWNKVYMEIFQIDGDAWESVQAGNAKILLAPGGGNAMDLDEPYKTADIIITDGCPENADQLQAELLVYTGDPEQFQNYSGQFARICSYVAQTSNGDISLDLRKEHTYACAERIGTEKTSE